MRSNNTYKWDCPFGEEDDCPNKITVETDEGHIYDVDGCHHVKNMTARQLEKVDDMLQDLYKAQYDEAMESRVDELRERRYGI